MFQDTKDAFKDLPCPPFFFLAEFDFETCSPTFLIKSSSRWNLSESSSPLSSSGHWIEGAVLPPGPSFTPPRQVERGDVEVKFVRSSGPGGQNVNKVSTKADLRLNVFDAEWLPEEVRMALLDMEANRVNSAGELVVQSDRTRTQK